MATSIECHIYRSKFKTGMYIYLRDKDDFDAIPSDLKSRLGTLEFSFSMTLEETRNLVRLDTKKVIQQLKADGYFLQMPPANTNFLDLDLNHSDGF